MALIGNLLVRMKADNRQFTSGMRTAQKEVRKFGRSVGLAKRQWKTFSRGMLRMAGVSGGIYGVVRGFRSIVEAAMRQEEADKRLAAALRMVGASVQDELPALKGFASRLQEMTVHGDEVIEGVMTKLINVGGLTGQRLRDATKATIGLAAKLGIDLQTATLLVARAAKGHTETLARYGVTLEKTLSPQEKFNKLLRLGAEAFKLAQAEAETTRGKLAQLRNAWGDMMEQLGKTLIAAGVPKALREITRDLKELEGVFREKRLGISAKTLPGYKGPGTFKRVINVFRGEEGLTGTLYGPLRRPQIYPATPTGPINPYQAYMRWQLQRLGPEGTKAAETIIRGKGSARSQHEAEMLLELRKIREALAG